MLPSLVPDSQEAVKNRPINSLIRLPLGVELRCHGEADRIRGQVRIRVQNLSRGAGVVWAGPPGMTAKPLCGRIATGPPILPLIPDYLAASSELTVLRSHL